MDLTRYLTEQGHRVQVWCSSFDEDTAVPERASVHLFKTCGKGGLFGTRSLVRAAARLPIDDSVDLIQGFDRTLRHDVYRAGGGAHRAYLEAMGWGHRARLSPTEALACWVDRQAMSRAKIVVCNSNMSKDQVIEYYRVDPMRVRVVRNGVDRQRFKPGRFHKREVRLEWRVPPGGRVALFPGSGFRRKGVAVAARAFAEVAGELDRLVIMGRDAHPNRHLMEARGLLGPRLIELGGVADPERALCGADATLLPTRYDSAANTTLEAMATGVPPVTSSMDGNAELVPDPRLVVKDPLDVSGFGKALRFAWSVPEGLGLACQRVADDWPVSRNGSQMERVYQELMDGVEATPDWS